jgi:hypothetical protein
MIHFDSDQIYRSVSFDAASTWLPWIKMKNHRTRRPVGFASTADGRTKYLAYQVWNPAQDAPFIPFADKQELVLLVNRKYGFDWSDSISPMGGEGKFLSGPAVLCSPSGNTLYLFGTGLNDRMFWAKSNDRGATWLWRWADMGPGTFKSEPAAVMSADGKTIMIFGIGMDDRCWMARTTDAGESWHTRWSPIGSQKFTSGLAACISASGRDVIVAGRSTGDRFFYNRSVNEGQFWMGDWEPIGAGVFDGGPALCCSWDFSKIHAFGVGRDRHIWRANALGENAPFAGWWKTSLGGV